jgi:hypothetical protein
MPRATCRCGEVLNVPADGPERITCPKCSARIRIRRSEAQAPKGPGYGDGFIRFPCPCGRRLKVRIEPGQPIPESGKCPDCGRVVPVPASAKPGSSSGTLPTGHPDALTEELSTADLATLDEWRERRQAIVARTARPEAEESTLTMEVPMPKTSPSGHAKIEAGLRVCPRCGKPVHMSAIVCRACGAHVPKK